jgi:hypothetical protein
MLFSSDNKDMIQKKYLLISLVAATALLAGCSANNNDSTERPSDSATSSTVAPSSDPDGDGVVNGSLKEEDKVVIPAKTFEEGAVDVVKLPASITGSKDFVEVPLGEVSGSIVETEQDTTVVYNTYKGPEIRQWAKDLIKAGWEENKMETIDKPTTFNALLSKDDKMIAIYANNTSETKNTVIAFSK